MAIQIPDPFTLPNQWASVLNDNWQEIKDRLSGITETSVEKDSADFDTAQVSTAPSGSTDVARKAETDAIESDLDGKADDPHGNDQHDASYTTTSPSDVDSSNWGDYEIQVDGTDGPGIINFKTE